MTKKQLYAGVAAIALMGVGPAHAGNIFLTGPVEDYGASLLHFPLFGKDAANDFQNFTMRANANDAWPYDGGSALYARECLSETLHVAYSLARIRPSDSACGVVPPWQLELAQPPAPI